MKKQLLFLLMIGSGIVRAEDSIPAKKLTVTPLPVVLYDPFTGIGYGGLIGVNYLLGNPKTTRYSNSHLFALHTTQRQTVIQAIHQIFFKDEKVLWQGKFQYLDWPEYVYGLGGHTPGSPPTKELISYTAIEFEERLLWRLGSRKNFIGPQYRLYDCRNPTSNQPDSTSFFEQHGVGNKGFVASGVGVHFVNDTRDNVLNAYTGTYLELAVNPYVKLLGSTQDWVNLRVDYRYYHSFKSRLSKVLATRILCEQAIGEVPYMVIPMPGRYFATRGYVQGRYRGKTFASAEAEYRSTIWERLGYVLFTSVHTVSEPAGGFRYLNPAAGAGLRIMLNKRQRINLRIDYAQGLNDNGGLYFQVMEVF